MNTSSGYFNSADKQTHLKILDEMKFNWIKIYNLPNINVLLNLKKSDSSL